jgi:hypothetical protein
MKSFLLSAALFLVGGLSACSSISVNNDYDTSVDFALLKTWSWLPEAESAGMDAQGVMSLSGARIREDLEGGLIARGYPKVASGGSFLVTFHTLIQQRIEAGAEPYGYGYGWRSGYAGAPLIYDEGSLIVDFIDPKSKTMVWRGLASGVVDPSNSPEKREKLIHEAVTKLLDQFPPKKK